MECPAAAAVFCTCLSSRLLRFLRFVFHHCNSERPGFSWACWAVPLAEPRWYGLAGKVGCPMLVPTACPLGDGFACLLGLHALLFPDSAVLSKIGAEKITAS